MASHSQIVQRSSPGVCLVQGEWSHADWEAVECLQHTLLSVSSGHRLDMPRSLHALPVLTVPIVPAGMGSWGMDSANDGDLVRI